MKTKSTLTGLQKLNLQREQSKTLVKHLESETSQLKKGAVQFENLQ